MSPRSSAPSRSPQRGSSLGISEETAVRHLKIARECYSVPFPQMLILCALFDAVIGFSDVCDWWRPL